MVEIYVTREFSKMDKINHPALSELFVKKCLSRMEIHNEMINVLGDAAPSEKWFVSGQFNVILYVRTLKMILENDPPLSLIHI